MQYKNICCAQRSANVNSINLISLTKWKNVLKRYQQMAINREYSSARLFHVNGLAYTEVDASLGFGLRFIGVVDQCFFVPVEDKPPLVPG